ncbi:MAG: sigma-70 family RNA polymerase sigma factor [Oscillospiraceae bacterium]|nr:sigma-70 family RNA polymerase sigma factor [Oscillospiraceae bacterium]
MTATDNYLGAATDEELLERIDTLEGSVKELLKRYSPKIRIKARSMTRSQDDTEDLIQEGFLGLLSAVAWYDKSKNVKFCTYAEICIVNKMKTALKKNNRKITQVNSLEESVAEADLNDPEIIYLRKERISEFYMKLSDVLSNKELEVFRLFLKGSTYEQMACQLNIPHKAVDNAMQRVRRKLKSVWRADHFNFG